MGDDPGVAGGVVSGKIMGSAEYSMFSMDVMFEGAGVCRMGDSLFHNKKNIIS